MIIFYAPDIVTSGLLPPDESHHAVKVLRLRDGDILEAIDGRGFRYQCRITRADARGTAVEILGRTESPLSWSCPSPVPAPWSLFLR